MAPTPRCDPRCRIDDEGPGWRLRAFFLSGLLSPGRSLLLFRLHRVIPAPVVNQPLVRIAGADRLDLAEEYRVRAHLCLVGDAAVEGHQRLVQTSEGRRVG